MACVYVPVQNSEEEVRVVLDQLPKEANDIIDILKAEQASLDLWLIIARKYFEHGKLEQFRQILYYYLSYRSAFTGLSLLIMGAKLLLGVHHVMYLAIQESMIDYGALASKIFKRKIGKDSLELYKRAMQVHPDCPAAARLGIGLCCYKMGQFDKARQSNIQAILYLIAAGIRKGMEKMQTAFEIYPYCAMASNYLANHFFYTGQHFVIEQLTETALAVTNHGPTKSHSYYNLARSYHSKGDYEKAGVYYMASVKEISKPHEFVFPYYGLGQVQLKMGYLRSSLSNFEKVLEVYPDNSDTLKVLGHIYVQLGQTEKALEFMRKATKVDPDDSQALLDLGELLISFDAGAALDCLKTMNEQDDEENVQDPLAAVGLEDSDADKEAAQSTDRRRRAFSESGDDEQQPESSPVRENSAELQSDGEGREGGGDKQNGDADLDDED
ncbi:protein CTR9 homolog [Pyrus x bretschneideri]|uniref:protein CTR9 homolog n=1 Tax=Pyrus x bretschneideri TaxID=225117 RepID=UPI00202EDE42|nr:protein CTR9 homolog [Pyrus x bretschneideri]